MEFLLTGKIYKNAKDSQRVRSIELRMVNFSEEELAS